MKVLILAEQCNPEWASLPSFSHSLAKSIDAHVKVVLVTHIRNKEDIEKDSYKFEEVIYINNEYIASPLHKISSFLSRIGIGGWMTNMAMRYPANIAFEYECYKKMKKRIKGKEFDVIHRISPVSPTIPSPIAKWTDAPFIYGPINGGLPWPAQFRAEIKKEREVLVHLREFYKYLPYYKATFRKATRILAAFSHVENDIPRSEHGKIVRFNELGVYTEQYKPRVGKTFEENSSCCFLFVGRLVPYKCPHVAIAAFINSPVLRSQHRLDIVGDGPERESLQKMIDEHDLNHCIKLKGWMGQLEVAKCMANSDVFVFPSIREVGGNVLIEAMSAGLPSIVSDYGGPGDLISEDEGIKIPLADKHIFIDSCMRSMENLVVDSKLREKLSLNSREKALEIHDWSSKGKKIKEIYNQSLNG